MQAAPGHISLLAVMVFHLVGSVRAQDVEVVTGDGGGGSDAGGGEGGGGVPRWKLPLQVSFSVSGGYDDNANGDTSGGQASSFMGVGANVSYAFGTQRTHFALQSGTAFSYYPDLSTNRYDPNISLNLSVTHQVNLKMTLAANLSVSYLAEPDFSNNISLDRRVGNYFTTSDGLTLTYQWLPRWSTVTSYSFSTVLYDDSATASAFNRFDHSFSQSLRFLYLPVTTLVAQYSFSASVYDMLNARDTYTQSVLIGLDHTFSQKLNGFLRGGAEFTMTSGSAFQSNDGASPHFEAGLSYAVTGKTSVSWNASYAIQPSYVFLAPSSLAFTTTLVASYTITPRLHGNLACSYRHDENSGIKLFPGFDNSFTDDSVDVSLGLTYTINRFLSANAGYAHTEVQYNLPDRSYSRNRIFGGLSFNF